MQFYNRLLAIMPYLLTILKLTYIWDSGRLAGHKIHWIPYRFYFKRKDWENAIF